MYNVEQVLCARRRTSASTCCKSIAKKLRNIQNSTSHMENRFKRIHCPWIYRAQFFGLFRRLTKFTSFTHFFHLDAVFSGVLSTCAHLQNFIRHAVKMLSGPVVAENPHPHDVFREAVPPDRIRRWQTHLRERGSKRPYLAKEKREICASSGTLRGWFAPERSAVHD